MRIWQASKKTIVFITHGIDEAVCLGERVAVMTSRPGRIKTIIDIPESLKYGEDVRSRPEYGAVGHEVWSRLRDEVQRAQEQERRNKLEQSALASKGKQVSLHV